MNSTIFNWEFKNIGIFLGHAYEWKIQYVEQIHIPPITPDNKGIAEQIERLADEILSAKKATPTTDLAQNPANTTDLERNPANTTCLAQKPADTTDLERQIDQLVYRLYDLTPAEIAIVEGEK